MDRIVQYIVWDNANIYIEVYCMQEVFEVYHETGRGGSSIAFVCDDAFLD